MAASLHLTHEAYSRHAAYIHAHLTAILRDESEAWDLTQETFVHYIIFLNRGGRAGYPLGFLYRAASRLAIKHLRRRRQRAKMLAAAAEDERRVEVPAGRIEARSLLRAVMDRLDPWGKVVAKALMLDEMSTTEICNYTGFSRGRVRRRITKIRALAKNIELTAKKSDPFGRLGSSLQVKEPLKRGEFE